MAVDLRLGDCREILKTIPTNSVDSIVTDPPYELGFMGKSWDKSGIANDVDVWREALRVLKPGGHLLAFGGTRTHHRMICAIEDAGFEIRDQIMWLYGSGFPKSHNLSNEWQGWGTALKPAHEPICVARKPLSGVTVASNLQKWGTGALNIDKCRVGWPNGAVPKTGTPEWGGPCKKLTTVPGQEGDTVDRSGPNLLGRWPANVIHDGSNEVLECFPDAPGQIANAKTDGARKFGNVYSPMRYGREAEPSANSDNECAVGFKMKPGARRNDTGSAARFFYCAKASKVDRNAGCAELPQSPGGMHSNTSGQHITRREEGYRPALQGNTHPTVKPTELMRYLCRLITPPGGTVLDLFMGSGSTGKAAVLEEFEFIGIELKQDHFAIAEARIKHAQPKTNHAEALPDSQLEFEL